MGVYLEKGEWWISREKRCVDIYRREKGGYLEKEDGWISRKEDGWISRNEDGWISREGRRVNI